MAAVVRRAPKAKNVGTKALILHKQLQTLLDTDDESSTTPKSVVEEGVNNFVINNHNNNRRQDRRRRNKIYTNINKKRNKMTNNQNDHEQEITKDDIQSIIIETPINVTIRLLNGTTLYNINPQKLHQRKHMDIWLYIRQMLDVTASEFSTILDQSYFTTRKELLTRKVTTALQQQQQTQQSSSMNSNSTTTTTTTTTTFVGTKNNEACKWGLAMEPIAFQQYIDATNNVVQETGLHIKSIDVLDDRNGDDDTSWQSKILLGASPDGLVIEKKNKNKPQQQQQKKKKNSKRSSDTTTQDDDMDIVANDSDNESSSSDDDDYEYGLLEIKCLYGQRTKKKLKQYEYCPKRFYDQIQGQLAICDDVSWCDLIVWIPRNSNSKNDNYSIVRVHRNETYWNTKLLPEIQTFVKEVRTRTNVV